MPRPTGTAFLLRRRACGISVADFIGFALSAPQADRLSLKAAILKAHCSPKPSSIGPVRGSKLEKHSLAASVCRYRGSGHKTS